MGYLQDVWALIWAALTLDTATLTALLAQPNAGWLTLSVVLLAGISKLAGDSVALFINRVPPRRFVSALLGGGIAFALELLVWAASIWVIATLFFQRGESFTQAWLVVASASVPWVFGFLVFAPYLGAWVRWVLRIWSWLIALVLLGAVFGLPLVPAFVCVTLGWLGLRALEALLARPLGALHARWWARLTGTPDEQSFEEQAAALAQELRRGTTS